MHIYRLKLARSFLSILFLTLFLPFSVSLFSQAQAQTAPDPEDETKQKQIIEEVVITGSAPVTQPISTVTLLPKVTIEKIVAKNLSDVIALSPGVTVSEGQKAESAINMRGMSSKRMTLMVDGVPIYEPYFNSFDLKSFGTANLESVKIIKGANSVLYGANTLGGVIDIVTQRPSQPFFNLKGMLSQNSTTFLSGSGGASFDKLAFFANLTWDKSDGFEYTKDGKSQMRSLSNYDRKDWTGKLYFYPTPASEIMAEVLVTDSNYGIPPALSELIKARYWVFDDWKRVQANLGYTTPFAGDGIFKARAFYVYHYNVLQDYAAPDLAVKRWDSTYKNSTFGANITGEKPIGERNLLKFSLHGLRAQVRTQGAIGDPWEEFNRTVLSFGLEDHYMLTEKWKVVLGAGIDHLTKNNGDTQTRFNPILGLRFSASQWLDAHLSLAMKSRFPSMKSLYSSKGGNPDLQDEMGRSIELGLAYHKSIAINASVFFNRYDDLIQSYRGLEGYKIEQNIGRVEIKGFELSVAKQWQKVQLQAGYTYLDAKDIDTNLKLDYTPSHQFDFMATIGEFKGFSFNTWINAISETSSLMGSTPPFQQLPIPGYTLLHAIINKKIGPITLFIKGENLTDTNYITEPGFPMRGRTVSFGLDLELKKY